ncbi:nucleotide disphospho-sugar-binding domain-containing protein [Streptomyces sp. NPDC058045]|uniref:nucleotide disphospho-sugar-binding domain-containing protein n=1 Tax=Streptomyces sp. NPDC058045 TaxID=3346311 RepID=UPI0036E34F2D
MRVLFTPAPISAHITLVAPLAWALQTAGHEVRVAVPPNFTGQVTDFGLTPLPVGESIDLMAAAGTSDPAEIAALTGLHSDGTPRAETIRFRTTWLSALYFGSGLAGASLRGSIDDLVAFARSWRADLVISGFFHGGVVARASGAAHFRMLTGLDHIGRMRTEFLRQQPAGAGDDLRRMVEETLQKFGCTYTEEVLTGEWALDPMPQALRLPDGLPAVPVRQIPVNRPDVPPAWLLEPALRPRVCLTLGLSGREAYGENSAALNFLAAAGSLDIEVVATLTAAQLPPDVTVPGNVRLVDFVPLDQLLPTCAAVIHHGGILTAFAALPHKVPQIIVPAAVWDESEVARYLHRLGAGVALEPEEATPERFAQVLQQALREGRFTQGVERAHRDLLAMPTPNEVVPALERLVARRETR